MGVSTGVAGFEDMVRCFQARCDLKSVGLERLRYRVRGSGFGMRGYVDWKDGGVKGAVTVTKRSKYV